MPNTAEILSASSWLTILACFIVVVFYLHRLLTGQIHEEARPVVIGVVFVAVNLIWHRTYWASTRLVEATGQGFDNWLYQYRLVTVIPLILMVYGYGLHLKPVLVRYAGKQAMLYWSISMLGVFVAILEILAFIMS